MIKQVLRTGLCAFALSTSLLVPVAVQARQDSHPADDTQVNKRDRDPSEVTADQAKNGTSDRELMRQIRREVVRDKSLSTYGHNVKIVADHGKVTLKGPVHTEEEHHAILEHARKYAGEGHVDDQLSVKGDEK